MVVYVWGTRYHMFTLSYVHTWDIVSDQTKMGTNKGGRSSQEIRVLVKICWTPSDMDESWAKIYSFPGEDPRGGSAFHPTLKTHKLGFPLALCCQPKAPAGAVKRAQIFHAKLSYPGFHAQIASTHRCSSPKEYPKNNQVFDLSPHHI